MEASWSNLGRHPPSRGGGTMGGSTTDGKATDGKATHGKRSSTGQAMEQVDRLTGVLERLAQTGEEIKDMAKQAVRASELQAERAAMGNAVLLQEQRRLMDEQQRRYSEEMERNIQRLMQGLRKATSHKLEEEEEEELVHVKHD
jgi:hypothetical protein